MLNDDKLEQYLREFRPRVVRPLERPRPAMRLWPLAVAAMVLVCGAAGWWYARRGGSSASSAKGPSMPAPAIHSQVAIGTGRAKAFALTKLALTDEAQFEAQLAMESRTVLPKFEGESTLRVLAKD
jgi:hypothetical protein